MISFNTRSASLSSIKLEQGEYDGNGSKHFLVKDTSTSFEDNIVAFVTTWLPMSEEMNYLTYSGYILARHSNFARAVYPALQHEIEAGIVSPDDG